MINEEDVMKLKLILQNMNNCDTTLEHFCEILDKESLGQLTFSMLKNSIDKHFSSIIKNDRLFLLKYVNLEKSGLINIYELFEFFSRILGKPIYSPVLAFYLAANIIEKKYKIKTLEFIYKIGLSLERELNANDFFNLICENLKVDEATSLIIFKGLDYKKKGLVRVEDFVIVVDSYRDDTVEDSFIPERINITNLNQENINVEKKEVEFFRDTLENNFLTVEEIFRKINESNTEYTNHVDLYNKISELLGDKVNDMFLRKILGFLKNDDKIYRTDLENLLVFKLDFKSKDIVDSSSLIKLNDVQIYWINKLTSLLDSIGVTPVSAFNISIQDKITKDRISLDIFKKKLKLIFPGGKITAQDITNIADSLDINRTKILTLQEYNEIISIAKEGKNQDNKKTNSQNKKKINSYVKESRSVNVNLLPIRGNHKIISQLKVEVNKKYNNLIGSNQNSFLGRNENKINDNTFSSANLRVPNPAQIRDETLNPTEATAKQEHDLKNHKAEKIANPSPNLHTYVNEIDINSFISDLEVFEEGEWKFFEILEEKIVFETYSGYVTIYNILNELKNTFSPLIPKAKIFEVLKAIDHNKNGYVSIKEITKFLLKYFKHKSTKLSLKEIARKIEFDLTCSTEEFFETKQLKSNSEMAFVYFTQFFINYFEIEPPVAKKIYEDMKLKNNKQTILVADVIDMINEYRTDTQNKNVNKLSMNSSGGEYSGLGILDKKSYEMEIRSFVKTLTDNFGPKLKENLNVGLNLSKTMNLMYFRENFVDKLNMDLALGITTFQLLKNFSHKDEQIITKDDLFMFLESYIISEESEEGNQIESIIGNIEMVGCPLKIVFEHIKYNPTGYVTTYEVLKSLETFYPNFNRKNLMTIIKTMDSYKNGFISYNNLQSFIIKYSKRSSLSINLEFKRLASIVDSSSSTGTFEFFKNKGVRNFHNIDVDEHRDIMKTLITNNEIIEEIFNFLCERSKNSTGYDIQRVIEQIDVFRENHSTYVVDVGEEITKQNQNTNSISKFLSDLNDIKVINNAFDKLNLGEYQQISILEIFKALSFYYPNADKSKIMNYLKLMDNNSQGFVSYEQLNKSMKRFLPNYEASSFLHSKYLAKKILKEHENFSDYLSFKNLTPNSSLNQIDFFETFKEEFLKDQELCLKVFQNLKENSGKYLGNIIVQNFIDFISLSSVNKLGKVGESEKINNNKEDSNEPVESILVKLENIKNKPLRTLFDHINVKQINQYGKINTDTINSILKEHFPIREELINKFSSFFSSLNTLFDLNKLVEFLQSNSGKSEVSIKQIVQKITSSLVNNKDTDLNLFLQKYNLKLYDPFTIIDTCLMFPPIFGVSLYECFVLTQDMLSSNTNSLKDEGKFNLDSFFCHHCLYEVVKQTKKSEQIRIDGYMKLTLKSLSEYLEREKDSLKLFKSFDINHDGVLSKEEFLNILNNLKDLQLNDYQKIGIIKIADKSKDDNINYPEFLEFLKIIKDDAAFDEKIRKNTDFIEKIDLDYNKLKENLDYNKRNMGEIVKDNFRKSVFTLQEEFYNQFNDFNNIESELQKLDFSNGEYLISYQNFYSILESRFDDYDNYKDKYINFSYEGIDANLKKKLTSNENINYKHFLKNLVLFKYAKSKEEILSKKKKDEENKKKEVEEKKKQEQKSKKEEKIVEENTKLAHTSKIIKKDSVTIEEDEKKLSGTVKLELPPIKENHKDSKKQKLLELRKQKDEERKRILDEKRKGDANKVQTMKNPFAKKDENEEEKKSVNESIGEVIQLGKTQSFRISENILKDIENKEKFKSLLNMSNNIIKVNIDFNNPEAIEKAQRKLLSVFATQKKDEFDKIKQTPEDKLNFLNFVVNINSFNYKGYDYHIDPEKDYFKRPDGKKIETILNSEDAAIKKCEEIFSKLPEKEEFFDKDFGPQLNDNGIGNKFSLYINGTCPKGHMDPSLIDWYRMTEISPDKSPQFFDDTIETNDVMQGALGDCWFISALSVIATKDHLLRGQFEYSIVDDGEIDDEENVMLSTGVYPPIFHGFRRKNIFCFRFFKNCKWRYVIIDDRLPCRKVFQKGQVPKLIYARCRNESEFWVPLIEKAYAKLHGSYESLISGFIDDGLVDLTGYVARKMFITPDQIKDKQQCEQLWAMISSSTQISFKVNEGIQKSLKSKMFSLNNSMLGCSVDAKVVESEVIFQGHKSGILAGHAYAVLDAFEVDKVNAKNRKKSRLLRIRNPWGFKEWNGKWSDESEELELNQESIEKTLKERYKDNSEQINLNAEDGTFLMCFSDFRQIFNKMFLCVDFPPNTIGIRFHDKWTTAESGGLPINNTPKEFVAWAKNPQYYLKIEKNTTIFISLIQNDGRLTKDKFPFPSITKKACIIVAKSDKKKKLVSYDKSEIKNVSSVRQHRENSMQLLLPKGEYIIIPSIFKEGDTGEFNLQLYIDDEFVDENYNENNFLDKMKYTKIERLEPKFNIKKEIIEEELSDFSHVLKRKKEFIYSQFKSLINDPNEIDTYIQHNEIKEEENEDII